MKDFFNKAGLTGPEKLKDTVNLLCADLAENDEHGLIFIEQDKINISKNPEDYRWQLMVFSSCCFRTLDDKEKFECTFGSEICRINVISELYVDPDPFPLAVDYLLGLSYVKF